jgi:hypothetical protein
MLWTAVDEKEMMKSILLHLEVKLWEVDLVSVIIGSGRDEVCQVWPGASGGCPESTRSLETLTANFGFVCAR